jgi:DNA invertase Pin-like site-specific DNA recombinase
LREIRVKQALLGRAYIAGSFTEVAMQKRAAIYVRVSTDKQTVENQVRELRQTSRRRFDVVMAWAIDRLGRSLIDLLGTIQALEASGVDLFLEQQAIDTTTPAGKLMFQVTGAFAEFERSMIRQRVNAGLKRAVEQGKQLGRPRIDPKLEQRILSHLRKGTGILTTAKLCEVGTGTVQRIKEEMSGPFVGEAA